MKFNFKKIASVIASSVMLTSTVALAAAANYPAPFVKNGAADVAVVYGANAAQSDLAAVIDITTDLQEALASQTATTGTTGATTSGGDSVKIETGSTKLHIGSNLTDVRSTTIEAADMPNLLMKKTYQAKDGSSYDYEQNLKLATNLQFGLFADVDFNNRVPTLGVMRPSNAPILNYTISFTKTVESSVSTAGRMTDLENTKLTLLGKEYTLLNAFNNTNIKLELMGGAVSDTLALDESKDYTIGDKTYTVKVPYVNTGEAKLEVNGELTNKMNIGGTQKLKDGTQVGIRDVLYQNFAGGVMKVEFSLGAEKLTLEDTAKLKLNDNNVNDVSVDIIEGSGASGKRTISKIVLVWTSNDKTFIAEGKDKSLPGLNSLTFKVANYTTYLANPEEIAISNTGDKTLQIKLPIKSGTATVPVLSLNSSGGGISRIGGDSTGTNLVTGTTEIGFNRTTDQYFVASWASTTDAESYLLKITSVTRDNPSTGLNSTVVTNAVTGEDVCKDKKAGDSCTLGNVVLNINAIDVNGNGWVNITGGSGVNFRSIYTPSRMTVNLPINNLLVAATKNNINLTAQPTSWTMTLEEADKSNNLGSGKDVNLTVSIASSKIEVGSIVDTGFSGGDKFDLGGSSTISKYVAYLTSDLGTRLVYDTKPDQNTLTVYNNGGESTANVFLAAPETTVISGSGAGGGTVAKLGSVSVSDAEAASVASKNLIVIGGSCINSVAASLLGGALCGADFEASTGVGAGSYLIQTFDRGNGKVATLVAGYNAGDTTNAAKALLTQAIDTSVGKKYKDGVAMVVTTQSATA